MIDSPGPHAETDALAAAAATRRLHVALRVVSGAMFTVLGIGSVLLLAAKLLTGFSRPSWLPGALLACVALFAALLGVVRWLRSRLRARGVDLRGGNARRFTQMPRAGWIVLASLWGIAELTLVAIGAAVAVPAYELGAHPAVTQAVSVVDGPECYRCSRPVIADFVTADGVPVTARLAGADGTQDGDRPGEALVYDAAHPERVMRASDWHDGRGGTPGVLFLVALGMLLVQVAVTVVLVRGRRAAFGQLRPGIGIRMVSTRPVKGGTVWRVTFVDGTATSYADSARFRAALRDRVVAGYGTLLSDGARERLGVVWRTDGVDGWEALPTSAAA